ncbi:MAG: helix-turn-helix domain-containing protein [Chloroflexi bacterium]|nr:helix-turn-helix domain-containing protein [Chloroflexota bacterium]
MSDSGRDVLSATQAAALLGVKTSTLYAYVSRGLLRSHRSRGNSPSLFSRAEVEQLAQGRPRRRSGSSAEPVEDEVASVRQDALLYRGLDACELAAQRRFEEVAEWLWTGEWPKAVSWEGTPALLRAARGVQKLLPAETLPVDRLAVVVPVLAALDPLRLDLAPESAAITSRSLIACMVGSLPRVGARAEDCSVAARLWPRLTKEQPDPLLPILDQALVLLADNGARPPASATARLAASLRSDPYGVVSAALGVGAGAQQARPFLTLQALFDSIDRPSDHVRVLAERFRRGDDVPGFHSRQYGRRDPRADFLLEQLSRAAPSSPRLNGILRLVAVMEQRRDNGPSVEVAVAALAAVAGMRQGAGEAIFHVARTAGWLARALQVYAQPPRRDLPSFVLG